MTERCVIALGTFDGLHPGHRCVLQSCMELARKQQAVSMVYTFYENPKSLFGNAPIEIMSAEEKISTMLTMGIERVEAVHFTRELASLTPEEFVMQLADKYHPCAFVCGEDYSFGRGGEGRAETLKQLSEARGIEVCVVPLVTVRTADGPGSEKVSSTLIRDALSRGDNEAARKLIRGDAL